METVDDDWKYSGVARCKLLEDDKEGFLCKDEKIWLGPSEGWRPKGRLLTCIDMLLPPFWLPFCVWWSSAVSIRPDWLLSRRKEDSKWGYGRSPSSEWKVWDAPELGGESTVMYGSLWSGAMFSRGLECA